MPYISVQGYEINYIGGDNFRKSHRSILMIHGAGQSAATWEYQIDALKNHSEFNLFIPNLPGHGRSQGNGFRSVREYSNFIKFFADALDLEKVILVGHSMGGAAAQLFALDFPERVCACVLVGTGTRIRVAGQTLLTVKDSYETFCEVAPVRAFAASASEELKRKFREGLAGTRQEISYWDLMACNEFDIDDEVEQIKAPTLIISGDEDILTPVKYGEELNRKIPGSTFHVIEKTGHFMMQEKPDEFNRVLLRFLDLL